LPGAVILTIRDYPTGRHTRLKNVPPWYLTTPVGWLTTPVAMNGSSGKISGYDVNIQVNEYND
jgi:hypothetical protein